MTARGATRRGMRRARFSRKRVNNCYIPERMQRTAGTRPDAARRRVASSALALCCAGMLGGCLVTDSIEPPPEPNSPPVVTSPSYSAGSVILFDKTKNPAALRIPIEVRDEDTTEPLKVRWRVITQQGIRLDYVCPEVEITGTGTVLRDVANVDVPSADFNPGTCSVVELVVSANFIGDCMHDPEPSLFDRTTNRTDNDAALGRAFFWVWEVSTNPLADNAKAQQLLSSCPTLPYQMITPTPGMATMTEATSP